MRSSWLSVACAVSSAIAQSSSAALIHPVSQSRSVSAQASVEDIFGAVLDSDSDSSTSADFGSFGATANATFGGVFASAQSSHSSALIDDPLGPGTEGIGVSGQTSGDGNSDGIRSGYSQANSSFSITFALDQPTPYVLSFSLFSVFDNSTGTPNTSIASFTLRGGPGDEVIASGLAIDSDVGGPPQMGVLPPGEYLLDASARTSHVVFLGDSSARYQVELYVIPEPSTAVLLAAGLAAFAVHRRSARVAAAN